MKMEDCMREMERELEREMTLLKGNVLKMSEEEKTKWMVYMLYKRVFCGVSKEEVSREKEVGKEVESVKQEKVGRGRQKLRRIPMPYTGMKKDCCESLRENYGLYTQCENVKAGEDKYCKECTKEKAYDKYGNVEKRESMEKGKYVDPRGKKESNYKKVLDKMGISKEEALEEGKKVGVNIEDYYTEVEVKRGRPKKVEEVVVERKEEVEEKEVKEVKGEKVVCEVKRKKGRPRKAEKVLESKDDEEEDIFMEIAKKMEKMEIVEEKKVEERKVEVINKVEEVKKVEERNVEVVEEVVEDRVKKIKYEGKDYLKSKLTNIVYNMEEEIVGRWDEKEGKIMFIGESESEEEYESEEEEEEDYI